MSAGEHHEKTRRDNLEQYEQQAVETPEMQQLHDAVLREQFAPSEGEERVPVLLFIAILATVMWGGWYLSEYDASFDPRVYDGPGPFLPAGAEPREGPAPVEIDPMVVGQRVYNNCNSCHQRDGQGLPGQYPPLADSEWVLGDERILARILVHGLRGPIEVRGQTYSGEMPDWDHLSDEDIAAVLTYIRGSFGNDAAPVSPSVVSDARRESRASAWTAADLRSLDLPPAEPATPTEAETGAE